jgi:CheY-like chemotaxis protein
MLDQLVQALVQDNNELEPLFPARRSVNDCAESDLRSNGEICIKTNEEQNKNPTSADHRKHKLPESELPPYRILVVDDEPDVFDVLTKGLERQGFHVIGFTDPQQALSNFERHKFDIVLTDIKMPNINGIELYRRLRAVDSEVLICFVTAYEHFRNEFELTFPEEQVGCFIPKPFNINKVVSTVARKMEERERMWRGRTSSSL